MLQMKNLSSQAVILSLQKAGAVEAAPAPNESETPADDDAGTFVCEAVVGIGCGVDPNESGAGVGDTEAMGVVVPPTGVTPNEKPAPDAGMFVCKAVAGIGWDVDPNENGIGVGAAEAFVAGVVIPSAGVAPNERPAP